LELTRQSSRAASLGQNFVDSFTRTDAGEHPGAHQVGDIQVLGQEFAGSCHEACIQVGNLELPPKFYS